MKRRSEAGALAIPRAQVIGEACAKVELSLDQRVGRRSPRLYGRHVRCIGGTDEWIRGQGRGQHWAAGEKKRKGQDTRGQGKTINWRQGHN